MTARVEVNDAPLVGEKVGGAIEVTVLDTVKSQLPSSVVLSWFLTMTWYPSATDVDQYRIDDVGELVLGAG